ncbi:MAG: pseudouridylate synthase [Rhodocyclales bacterium]|nr:pseudouridylate synthase [Rhodocyclales bacterium]
MLTILYRDDQLVAIDKPAGWLVHRSNLDRHETRILVQALRDQLGQYVYPAHRLDKGTSGVMLFALDPAAAGRLGAQFERHTVRKTYWAVVRGWPPESGRIDHPIRSERDEYGDAAPDAEAQAAITEFRRLATVELPHTVDCYPTARYALMELRPLTGRRHQLRRHMKHIAHPIIGDATHGKGCHNRWFQAEFGCDRLLLACTELGFRHPTDGREMVLGAPVGDQFAALLARLGWPGGR